jgi:hypothetical protein
MRWTAVALVATAACRTAQGPSELTAVVVHPTPESRAAIAQAVTRALPTHSPVDLDDDALTNTGVIVLVQAQRRDPQDLVFEGRDPGAPGREERFHLVKMGEQCELVHDRTGRHYPLIGTTCAPR